MSVPANRRHSVCCSAAAMRAGEGRVRSLRLYHLREDGGMLVCAEGESTAATLPSLTTDIWCAGERLLAHRSSRKTLTLLSNNRIYLVGEEVLRVVEVAESSGDKIIVVLCSDGTYYFSNIGVTTTKYSPAPSTTNLVLHHERLFGAAGQRICYTTPFDIRSWTSYGEQASGWCDLLPGGGDVVDVVGIGGKVYFLREHGITQFTGYADVYNFRLEDVQFEMGSIVSPAAVIGGYAYFFTACGLCRFDGSRAERAPGAGDEEIDTSQILRIGTAGEQTLAASVKLRDGSTALYLYEPAYARGRFVGRSFEKIAAGDGVYLMRGGTAYRLTGRALPANGSCRLTAQFSLADLGEGEKRLEGVLITGSGAFRVGAAGEDGVSRSRTGEAGKWMDFAAGVRGETLTLSIESADADLAIDEIALRIRREDRV